MKLLVATQQPALTQVWRAPCWSSNKLRPVSLGSAGRKHHLMAASKPDVLTLEETCSPPKPDLLAADAPKLEHLEGFSWQRRICWLQSRTAASSACQGWRLSLQRVAACAPGFSWKGTIPNLSSWLRLRANWSFWLWLKFTVLQNWVSWLPMLANWSTQLRFEKI